MTEYQNRHGKPTQTSDETLRINLPRLREDVETLGKIGLNPEDGGVYRPSFSAADMEARRWLIGRMKDAGLVTHMDGVGNVIGRWSFSLQSSARPSSGSSSRPPVMIGSHLDSVPRGGTLDGSLGVLAGLEVIRSLMDAGIKPDIPIEVIATSEEEGRFGGMLGSQALAGAVTLDWLQNARDSDGVSLREAMSAAGLDYRDALKLRKSQGDIAAFLELHIEQGPVLDNKGLPVGIVEGISGVIHWTVTLKGASNHAGTTPMDMRKDALAGLAGFACNIQDIIQRSGTDQSRITIGKVELQPNFPHTVPGLAEFSLIIRDMDEAVMDRLARSCRDSLMDICRQHGLLLDMEPMSHLRPKLCNGKIIRLFEELGDQLGLRHIRMPSGAGHDTQFMADIAPAGMIFVPSVGGVSHSTEERTEWEDIEKGANLLLHAVFSLTTDLSLTNDLSLTTGDS